MDSPMPLISSNKQYKFEVAFSFLERDEAMAYALNDLIQNRLSSFIYSQHQKDLVGKDGMVEFKRTFAEDARIVVVLYRDEWGTTKMTRVEEAAIKERAFDEGPDFIVLINLDRGKPKWLSQAMIRLYLERYGLKAAAAAIEERVQEFGGVVREESVLDQATRHQREIERKRFLASYHDSMDGVNHAKEEFHRVFNLLIETLKVIPSGPHGYQFAKKIHEGTHFICSSDGCALGVHWRYTAINSLYNSGLTVELANAAHYSNYDRGEGMVFEEAEYRYSLSITDARGWYDKSDTDEWFYSSDKLVEFWFKKLLDRIRQVKVDRENARIT